jgi:uncharacterized membrane protein YhaH (DUF805 family)
MFKNPFSFEGRIRRTEYGITFILCVLVYSIYGNLLGSNDMNPGLAIFILIFHIFLLWFFYAQGTKRCHDIGISGWMQLIPFYPIYLIFAEGDKSSNKYGNNSKGNTTSHSTQQVNKTGDTSNNTLDITSTGYNQGSYYGGHNNTSTNVQGSTMPPIENTKSQQQEHGYKGNLYNLF